MIRNFFLWILLFSTVTAFGFYEATVTWEPNPDEDVVNMRIYQINVNGGNIAGYSSFPYADLEGTFQILNGCVEVFGRAYTSNGRISVDSNRLELPCLCPDCTDPDNPPDENMPPPDGHIKAISGNSLTFQTFSGRTYDIYCRTSLIEGDWVLLDTVTGDSDEETSLNINIEEQTSCFYTVIPR